MGITEQLERCWGCPGPREVTTSAKANTRCDTAETTRSVSAFHRHRSKTKTPINPAFASCRTTMCKEAPERRNPLLLSVCPQNNNNSFLYLSLSFLFDVSLCLLQHTDNREFVSLRLAPLRKSWKTIERNMEQADKATHGCQSHCFLFLALPLFPPQCFCYRAEQVSAFVPLAVYE